MNATDGERVLSLGMAMVDEQLRFLPTSLAAVARHFDAGAPAAPDVLSSLRRKSKPMVSGSGGNIVAEKADKPDKADPYAPESTTDRVPQREEAYRLLISNALLAVGAFMRAHEMLTMRTPEIQFLSHVVDALLSGGKFWLAPGYMPIAVFDGLSIDAGLNGKSLFAEGDEPGFMELGDAVALLQWLSRYLHGERRYVSGGDAG